MKTPGCRPRIPQTCQKTACVSGMGVNVGTLIGVAGAAGTSEGVKVANGVALGRSVSVGCGV